MEAVALIVLGFLSGSVMYSYLLPRLIAHRDIVAASPDHNPGAFNVFEYAGVPLGIACVILDIAKGALPVVLACYLLPLYDPAFALIIAAPVAGHVLAIFNPGMRGKGIATTFGVLIGLLPHCFIVFLLCFFYLVFTLLAHFRPDDHTVRTIATFCCFALGSVVLLWSTKNILVGCLLVSTIVVCAHIHSACATQGVSARELLRRARV